MNKFKTFINDTINSIDWLSLLKGTVFVFVFSIALAIIISIAENGHTFIPSFGKTLAICLSIEAVIALIIYFIDDEI